MSVLVQVPLPLVFGCGVVEEGEVDRVVFSIFYSNSTYSTYSTDSIFFRVHTVGINKYIK